MQKILCILGPTSIGKTALSHHFAERFGGDILVADSRQVYQGMSIVIGKDIPPNAKWNKLQKYWQLQNRIKIWLTDLVQPDEEFSVSHWNKYAKQAIEQLSLNKRLPIMTVGTGLYLRSFTGNIETLDVPPDVKLRRSLESNNVEKLYALLTESDSVRAESMNDSDRKNKRRLIRAIEVTKYLKTKKQRNRKTKEFNFFKVGLTAPKEIVFDRIDKRVDERLKSGALDETKRLLTHYSDWFSPAFSGVGYRYLKGYLLGKKKLDQSVKEWKVAERNYAKRQMTWFKKEPNVNWFDITDPEWLQKVEKLVGNWYNKN